MSDGAVHFLTVAYDTCVFTCPVPAAKQFITVGNHAGCDMSKGYIFPSITKKNHCGQPVRSSVPVTTPQMTKALKVYSDDAGEVGGFSMHSFRSGGAISQTLGSYGWRLGMNPCYQGVEFSSSSRYEEGYKRKIYIE